MGRIIGIISVVLTLSVLASCTDKEAMRQRLDYVSQCNRADTVFTEAWLPMVDSLVNYFDRHGNANEKMMAHYLKGRVYHDMGEAPIAIECYQQATEMVDTTSKDCDLRTLASIYGQMADLFHLQYLPDDEMNAIKKVEHFAWKNMDTLSVIMAYRLRTGVYHLRCDTDSMLYVTKKCIEAFHKLGYNDLATDLLIIPISVCLDRGQFEEAWSYMQSYENTPDFMDGDSKNGKGLYNYYKGVYLLHQNQTDSAIYYFRKANARGLLEAGNKGLLSAYEQKRIHDSIAKYAKLYAKGNDSTFMHVNQNMVHQISAQYKYTRQQRIAEENKLKATRLLLYLIIYILVTITIIVVNAYYVNKKRTKSMLQINQLISTKNELLSMLDEKQVQIETINEENTKLLETRLKEQALLQTEIEYLNKELEKFSNSEMEKAFSKTTMAQQFQTIRDNYPKLASPSSMDWIRFTKCFREHFNLYYKFITDGNRLSKDQLRVCMMIRLNFHEFEMVHFMNTDNQRINRVKQQVNKKLFGEMNSSNLRKNLKRHF
ncbi:MAG: hypothetical protein IKH63_12680 [Prevotella sp.]|nr:hypothetical protein [Prevotella sp.]